MAIVSVIIPTYNRSTLVVEAIECVLRQTFKDFEVIVVDDGSTDKTRTVVTAIKDARVRYFYKTNGGVSTARNLGLTEAKGDYICFLDSDDLWPENFLETMLDALAKNPDYDAAYCARTVIYPDGSKMGSYERKYCKSGLLTEDFFQKPFIQTSTLCFRRHALNGFAFEEKLRNAQDVDAWLRLSVSVKYLFVPSVEIIFRAGHGVSERSQHSRENCNRILLLERFYFRLGGDKYVQRDIMRRKLSHSCRSVAETWRKKGGKTAAVYLYKKAISYSPFDVRLYIGFMRTCFMSNRRDTAKDWKMPELLPDIATGNSARQ